MLGKTLLKGLIFVFTFVTWDLFFKNPFYGWITSQTGSETVGLAEAALGWAMPFISAFLITEILVRQLRLEAKTEDEG